MVRARGHANAMCSGGRASYAHATTMSAITTHSPTTQHPPVRISTAHPGGGVLGLLPELRNDALGLLARCSRDFGDFVRIRLGLTRAVVISHPELVEEVLVTRNHDFRKNLGARRLRSALGDGLLVSEGDFWLRQRRLMQPAFHRQRLDAMAETMVSTASRALDDWHAGQQLDIYHEMTEITLRISARALFGTDITRDVPLIRRSSRIMTEHIRSRLFSLMMLVPDGVPTLGNRRYAAAVRALDELVYRLIAERREIARADDYDLLGMLLAARDDDGRGMTDRQVRDEVLTIMSASYDTTALALTWALVLLAQHPATEVQMVAEIDAVLGRRTPTAADAPRLIYLWQILAETLRLYPSAWAIGREAVRDTLIGGQRISKGTTVLLSPWVLHRDPRCFEDPDAFRPERWEPGQSEAPRAYLPFGAGPHTCIGMTLARTELVLAVATLASRWRLRPADELPEDPSPQTSRFPMTVEAR